MAAGRRDGEKKRPRRLLFTASGRKRGHPRVMGSEHKKAPNRRNAKRQTAPKKPTEKAVTKPYEPTPQERAVMEAYLARRRETTPAPRMKVLKKGGVPQLSLDHPESYETVRQVLKKRT